jgi:CRISPR-associated protein Cas8a1/Csx13
MGRLTCDLHRPGMTALHRVGLAGLYMTLDAFERDPVAKSELQAAGLSWQLDDRRVELEFAEGKEQTAMDKLLDLGFQIDKQGYFRLPGLERNGKVGVEQLALLHQCLLGTFLQHNKARSTAGKTSRIIDIDDKRLVFRDFAPITDYSHKKAARPETDKNGKAKEGKLFDRQGRCKGSVKIVGWLYPGGTQRHVGFAESTLEEPIELALCLLFAPVGGIFLRLASHRRAGKARTALVLPTLTNLQVYSHLRRVVVGHGALQLTASSPTDAALQVALMAKANELSSELAADIRVTAFGTVSWAKQQQTRTACYTITPSNLPGLHNYELASRLFPSRWQTIKAKLDKKGNLKEEAHDFIRPSTAREIIADNVASQGRWYAGFADYMSQRETRISLHNERKELYQMTQQAHFDQPNETIFIATCHEAWRRRLGQIGERAKREHRSFCRLASGEYEKLRVSLARCRNAASLRAVVTDFWSRAGSLPSLQSGWNMILPLLDEAEWRKARDLALLALASYQPSNPDEAQALAETAPTHEEGTEE